MTDIVERLRRFVTGCDRPECSRMVFTPIVCEEAADEIERLRAALRLWGLIDWDNMTEHDQALLDEAINGTRTALKEDGDD